MGSHELDKGKNQFCKRNVFSLWKDVINVGRRGEPFIRGEPWPKGKGIKRANSNLDAFLRKESPKKEKFTCWDSDNYRNGGGPCQGGKQLRIRENLLFRFKKKNSLSLEGTSRESRN